MSTKMRRKGPPPEGRVRRSQLLTGYGPGALVDLVEFAVVIQGLDKWRYRGDREGFGLSDPRLEAAALRQLRATGEWKYGGVRLREPPRCDDDDPSIAVGIPTVVFPGWFLCQNPRCRSLVKRDRDDPHSRHQCLEGRSDTNPMVPFRFIAACSRGHLMDIHWRGFVHRWEREEGTPEEWAFCHRRPESGKEGDELGDDWSADLYLRMLGTSGDLSDYLLGCRRCGKARGLQDLTKPNTLGRCVGWRPWLGQGNNEPDCAEQPRLLVRTASNTYFHQTLSALRIPDKRQAIQAAVGGIWEDLKNIEDAADLDYFLRKMDRVRDALKGLDPKTVLGEILRRRAGLPEEVPPLREAEWASLMSAPLQLDNWVSEPQKAWDARRLELDDPPDFIDRIVLVHAMRELRAQVGFTRIEGISGDAEGELALDGQRTAPLGLDQDWIPAVELRGEGFFIAFNEDAIRQWEAEEAVRRRAERFRRSLLQANVDDGRSESAAVPFGGARLLLLHSLSHMLITAISLECGYGASAIKERLYCYRHPTDPDKSRAGILLYTGTPGSEGTLGGLVEVGRDILRHLKRAAELAMLCSNDPVCAQHDPTDPQEGRDREGAACHACLLIAEPSCERMNRDLDRTFVVPTVVDGATAFLKSWLD